ncbi:MAG: hypothetical protein MZU97_16525 [Bacillus subtilis]|nr:hypothetical protein [Bacillus subtilis]
MAKSIELERTPDLFEEYLTWPKQSYRLKSTYGYELQCHYIPNSTTNRSPVSPIGHHRSWLPPHPLRRHQIRFDDEKFRVRRAVV